MKFKSSVSVVPMVVQAFASCFGVETTPLVQSDDTPKFYSNHLNEVPFDYPTRIASYQCCDIPEFSYISYGGARAH